jgi:hypothetical protein
MTPSEILRLPALSASQRVLFLALETRAVDGWAAAPPPAGCPRSDRGDRAALRKRGLVDRAARFERGRLVPGLYVRHAGTVSGAADEVPAVCRTFRPAGTPYAQPEPIPAGCRTFRQAGTDSGPPEETALLLAAATGDGRAQNAIARRYFDVSVKLAARLGAAEVAGLALTTAIRTFDPERGAAFKTFLGWCVLSAARDERRRTARNVAVDGPHRARRGDGGEVDVDHLSVEIDVIGTLAAGWELEQIVAAGGEVAVDLLAGRSLQESAERLGVSVHAIRRRRTQVRALSGPARSG